MFRRVFFKVLSFIYCQRLKKTPVEQICGVKIRPGMEKTIPSGARRHVEEETNAGLFRRAALNKNQILLKIPFGGKTRGRGQQNPVRPSS